MKKAAKKAANNPEQPKLSKEKILPAVRATLSTASTTLTIEQLARRRCPGPDRANRQYPYTHVIILFSA